MSQNLTLMTIKRTNGQTFFFNMSTVGMVYENPADSEVFIYGNGWEKKFRTEEAAEFLKQVKAIAAQNTPAA